MILGLRRTRATENQTDGIFEKITNTLKANGYEFSIQSNTALKGHEAGGVSFCEEYYIEMADGWTPVAREDVAVRGLIRLIEDETGITPDRPFALGSSVLYRDYKGWQDDSDHPDVYVEAIYTSSKGRKKMARFSLPHVVDVRIRAAI